MSARPFEAEIMAQPEADRLDYALDLLAFHLDPVPAFFEVIADLGLRLSDQEARLLHALYRRRGRFVSVHALMAAALAGRPVDDWPEGGSIYARIARVKSELARARVPAALECWPGVGYRLELATWVDLDRVAA